MNEIRKDQIPDKLPNPSQDPSPVLLPKNLSDRDKSFINKEVRKEFYNPPARKRKLSHQQERQARAK
jgi:hypothetical protein